MPLATLTAPWTEHRANEKVEILLFFSFSLFLNPLTHCDIFYDIFYYYVFILCLTKFNVEIHSTWLEEEL